MSDTFPPARQRGWALAMLMSAGAVSFLDRQILSLLVVPIQSDFKISDTQISLLLGFAFVATYAVAGLPLGRAVDKYPRFPIISAGVSFWTLMTALCAGASGFWQLFLLRMGVGIGEASLNPATYSLLPDLFPARRLGLALSLFTLGIYFGSGLALVLGAQILWLMSAYDHIDVPLIGSLRPWQFTFLVAALPGIAVAIWAGFMREPPRRGDLKHDRPPLGDVLIYLRTHMVALGGLMLAWSFAATIIYATSAWIPTFLIRTYGWTAPEAGWWFGITLLLSNGGGIIAGGMLSDWAAARRVEARLFLMLVGGLPAALSLGLFPLVGEGGLALLLAGIGCFFLGIGGAGFAPGLQEAVPNRMRGVTSALALMIVNIVGLGAGPTTVALVTDYVFEDPMQIRYSLASVLPASILISMLFAGIASRKYRAAYDAARSSNNG